MVDPHVPIIQDLDVIRNCQVWIRDYFQRRDRRRLNRRQNARQRRAIAAREQARLREINLNQLEIKFTHEYRAWYQGNYHNWNLDRDPEHRNDLMLFDYDKPFEEDQDILNNNQNYLYTMCGTRMLEFLNYAPPQFRDIIVTYQLGCLKRLGVTVRLSKEAIYYDEDWTLSSGQEFTGGIFMKDDYDPISYKDYVYPEGINSEDRFAKIVSMPNRLIWTYTELKNKGYKRKFYDMEVDNGWGRGWRNSLDFNGRNLRIVAPFVLSVGANQRGMPRGSPIFSFFVDYYFTFRRNGV